MFEPTRSYLSAVLAAILIAGLTACVGGVQQASTEAATSTATPTSSPAPTRTHASRPVPDVTGKTFDEAYMILMAADFYGYAYGNDGKRWPNITPDASIAVVSTTPAAGTVTSTHDIRINVGLTEAEASAVKSEAKAPKVDPRYEFVCAVNLGFGESDTYHSLNEVWASKYYAGSGSCIVRYDGKYSSVGDKPAILPSEQKIVDIVAANGGRVFPAPIETFDTVLGLCIKLKPDYTDGAWDRVDPKKAQATAALALCPDVPHAAVLRDVLTAMKVVDGTYVVGQRHMEPGTYRTKPAAKDCYWSRTNGGGDIIANNFIGFAPDGVTVTVYVGEGFESQRCGVWTKIG
jgi:hypothetical protein